MRHGFLALLVVLGLVAVADAQPLRNVVSWTDNATNEVGQEVWRKVGAIGDMTNPWLKIADVSANITTYVDVAVVEGSEYCYRVRAGNEAGNSPFSADTAQSCRRIPFSTAPATPTGITVSP